MDKIACMREEEEYSNSFEELTSDCCDKPIDNPFFFCEDCLRTYMIDGICFRSMRKSGEIDERTYKQLLIINRECIDKCLDSFGLNDPK